MKTMRYTGRLLHRQACKYPECEADRKKIQLFFQMFEEVIRKMVNGIHLGIATKPTSPMTQILPHRTALGRKIILLGWLVYLLMIQCFLLPDLVARGQLGIVQRTRQPASTLTTFLLRISTITLTPIHLWIPTWRRRCSTSLTKHPQHTGIRMELMNTTIHDSPHPHRLGDPIPCHRLVGQISGPVLLGMTTVFIRRTHPLAIWGAIRLRDHTMTTL